MSNFYYSPAEADLEIIGVLDGPGLSYSYDLLVVWLSGEGDLYWGCDAGCSCPTPFESFTFEDLHPLTLDTYAEFVEAVEGHCALSADPSGNFACDKVDLLRKVWPLLNPARNTHDLWYLSRRRLRAIEEELQAALDGGQKPL